MDDQYGNAYITDPDSGRSIQLYGLSSDMSAFSMEGTTLKYTNLKDAATKLTEVANGSKVTLNVQWSANYHNAYSVYVSHEAYTANYNIEVAAVENGTVTFRDTSVQTLKATIDADTLGLTSSYAEGTSKISVDGTDVALSYEYLMKNSNNGAIQMNKGQSIVRNTTATPYEIDSIELHFASDNTANKARLAVTFGTAEITTAAEEGTIAYDAGNLVQTIDCDVEGATFFRVEHTTTNVLYLESIVINFVANA